MYILAWAKSIFGAFIHKFYSRSILLQDAQQGSCFAKTVLEYALKDKATREAYNLAEHFRHLIYLLAFESSSKMHIAW